MEHGVFETFDPAREVSAADVAALLDWVVGEEWSVRGRDQLVASVPGPGVA